MDEDRLILVPHKSIPADQLYYQSSRWQRGVKEAREDIRAGKDSGLYKNVEEALDALKKPVEDDK